MKQHQGLFLVGTVHLDREGAGTLGRLLDFISPCVITVEISRFSLRFRTRAMPVWFGVLARNLQILPAGRRGHALIRLMTRQLRLPWEWQTASLWAKRHEIRCMAIDTGEIARAELPAWHRELLGVSNLELLASGKNFDLGRYFTARRREAGMILHHKYSGCSAAHPLSYLGRKQWMEREYKVARRVEAVCKRTAPVVHICGWTHLVRDSAWKSLADLLEEYNPECILVDPDNELLVP